MKRVDKKQEKAKKKKKIRKRKYKTGKRKTKTIGMFHKKQTTTKKKQNNAHVFQIELNQTGQVGEKRGIFCVRRKVKRL